MAIQPFIPDPFGFITPIIAGQSWPEADEDKHAAAAQAYADAMADLITAANNGLVSLSNVNVNVNALSAQAFNDHWKQYLGSNDASIDALVEQYRQLADQALDARNETEYTKLVINIQIAVVAIQLLILAVSSFFTFGAAATEAGPLLAISQAIARSFWLRLIQEVAQMAIPDFTAQTIQSIEHHTDGYDGGKLGMSLATGVVGGLLGAGAGALSTRLARSSIPLWSFIGNQSHRWYGRAIEGSVNNVLTTGIFDAPKIVTGQLTDADWQSLMFAGINGGATGLAFHVVGSIGGHSTNLVTFRTDDGTVLKGREVSTGQFHFFTDQGRLTSTGTLTDGDRLHVTDLWPRDPTTHTVTEMRVVEGPTVLEAKPGSDGGFTPRDRVTIGDGQTPYRMPSGEQLVLANTDRLTAHYADLGSPIVDPADRHPLVSDGLLHQAATEKPFAHTVATGTELRLYNGDGTHVGTIRPDAVVVPEPGYTVVSQREPAFHAADGAVTVITLHQDGGNPVLTVAIAKDGLAVLPPTAAVFDSALAGAWHRMGAGSSPGPLPEGAIFDLHSNLDLLGRGPVARQEHATRIDAAVKLLRTWHQQVHAEHLRQRFARGPLAGYDKASVRTEALIVHGQEALMAGLRKLLTPEQLAALAPHPDAPLWTLPDGQRPLRLVMASDENPLYAVPHRQLIDGTPITGHHLADRRTYLDLAARRIEAAGNAAEVRRIDGDIAQLPPPARDEFWDPKLKLADYAVWDPDAMPVMYVAGPDEYGTVAERIHLAREIIRTSDRLHELVVALSGSTDPRAVGTALDQARASGLISPDVSAALEGQLRRLPLDPSELARQIDELTNRGHLTPDQGVLLLAAGDRPADFHDTVDTMTGLAPDVRAALHANSLAQGLHEVIDAARSNHVELPENPHRAVMDALTQAVADGDRTDPTATAAEHLATHPPRDSDGPVPPKLAETGLLAGLLDADPRQVIRDRVDAYLRRTGPQTVAHIAQQDPHAYQHVLDEITTSLNRHPSQRRPELRPPDGFDPERWRDLLHDLRLDAKWGELVDQTVDRTLTGFKGKDRRNDAETKLFHLLARAFAESPPPPGTHLVLSSDVPMCPACRQAGSYLADRYHIQITVTDPHVIAMAVKSGIKIGSAGAAGIRGADNVPVDHGVVNVIMHADQRGLLLDNHPLDIEQLLRILPGQSLPPGTVLRFLSCDLATSPAILHEIADTYGVEVVAAESPVWIDRKGNVLAAPLHPSAYGTVPAGRNHHGDWKSVRPGDPQIHPAHPRLIPHHEELPGHQRWQQMQMMEPPHHGDPQHAASEPNLQAPAPSYWRGADQLAVDLALLKANPPAAHEVRLAAHNAEALLTTRARLVRELTDLAQVPPDKLSHQQALKAEQAMRSLSDVDARLAAIDGPGNAALEQRLRDSLGTPPDPALADLAGALTRLPPTEGWKPQHALRLEDELSTLHAKRRELAGLLKVEPRQLRELFGHEADLFSVDKQQLREAIRELDHEIDARADDLGRLKQQSRIDARDLRASARSGQDPLGDFLHEHENPALDPTSLTGVQELADRALATWDENVRQATALVGTSTPANNPGDPRFAPAELSGAVVTDWVTVTPTLISEATHPTHLRAHPVPLPEHRSAEVGPHGQALPHRLPVLIKDHLDGWAAVFHSALRGDWSGLAKGISGASRREIETRRTEERTVTVGDTVWREVRTVYQITEDRGGFDYTYLRKTVNLEVPALPALNFGELGGLTPKVIARQRLQYIPPGQIRARWERSVVERTLIAQAEDPRVRRWPEPDLPGYQRYQRVAYDSEPTVTTAEHPAIEIKQVFRVSGEYKVPLTGLGVLGPQFGTRLGVEVSHTENIPLPTATEGKARFDQLARHLSTDVGALPPDAARFWRDLRNGVIGATGKEKFELELYAYVKQPLLGDLAVEAGQGSPLPLENLRELRGLHQWYVWTLDLPAGAPASLQALGTGLSALVTHAQTLVNNPLRWLSELGGRTPPPAVPPAPPNPISTLLNPPRSSDDQP